ncbi:MAG: murein biosynthesis integral membrane protein MurJ [Pseudomonadota bacterium]
MKLYRAFATVGGMTMISRVLGFVRDILIAAVLGTGQVADAFVVAFRFPNLFRRIFAEGAFNSAFVPLFSKRLEGDGLTKAKLFAEDALALLLTALLITLTFAELFMPILMYVIAPGFSDTPEKFDYTVLLTRIAFPYLVFVSLVALLSGILNALGRFVIAAFAPVLLNVVLITAMSLVITLGIEDNQTAGFFLVWGVFCAGALQLIMLVFATSRNGLSLRLKWPVWNADMKHLVTLGVPGILAGGVTQINILVGTIIASQVDRAVSYLYYADRIYQLPLGIVGIAIGVVLLPDLSKRLRSGDTDSVHNSQNRSLEFSLLLTLPAAVALFTVPEPIIRVLFERGAFDASDSGATALALAAFAWGLPAFVLIKVFSPAFFAREDTKTPMRYAAISMVVNVALSFALFPYLGHVGIAVATTLAGWVNAGLLWATLSWSGHFVTDDKLKRSLRPILISSLMMGGVLMLGFHLTGQFFAPEAGLIIQIIALSVLVISGFTVYITSAHYTGALHVPTFMKILIGRKSPLSS